ncbi:MAG: hypothetical protein JXB39_02930 [Deltaproteobacteria bacterium]|nr:hypothetical protein [Deltaproteobacteria bacterium]
MSDHAAARRGEPDAGGALGEAVFSTLGDLKAVSLKVGQVLAQVADNLPDPALQRLGRLFHEAPALPAEDVLKVLEAELGPGALGRFCTFEREPFAAASLGQVHRGTLSDGTPLAVKVQYPGVAEALEHDLDLLGGLASTVGAGGLLIDTGRYFRALREATLAELDYRAEAENLGRMAAAVARWPDLVVPRAHAALSTGRVLSIDLLDGPTLHAVLDRPAPAEARNRLGLQVIRAVLGPLFAAGLVNSDAHPGNFVVLGGDRLGLLDLGALAAIPPRRVHGLAGLVSLLAEGPFREGDRVLEALAAAGFEIRLRPGRAREFAVDFARIVAPPFRGPYAFADDPLLLRFARFKQERPLDFVRLRFDPALLPVFRALLGLHHALRRLAVRADLRPLLRELTTLGGRVEAAEPP